MLIKETNDMTNSERTAVSNTNNQYLRQMCVMPMGVVYSFAGEVLPKGYLKCDGSYVSKTEYPELFQALQYKYGGSGDSFALPNVDQCIIKASNTDVNEYCYIDGVVSELLTQIEKDKNVSYNIFSNALKGSASGETVMLNDVSPIEHSIGVKLSSADAKLYRSGKNLLPYPFNGSNNGQYVNYTFTDNGDGSITVKGQHNNSTGHANFYLLSNSKLVLPKGSYTASGLVAGMYLQGVRTADGVTVNFTDGLTLTETTEFKALFVQILKTNTTAYDTVIKPMLEMGTTATEYEAPVGITECVVNADGTANVPSLYPTTRLYTDTEGVTITAEYNKDINTITAEAISQNFEIIAIALDEVIKEQKWFLGTDGDDTPEDIVNSGTTGDCTWTLNDTVLTISDNGAMEDYDGTIDAPWGNGITKVIIENGVTNVGDWAFERCHGLTSITIPDSVTKIGISTFANCSSLESITLPKSVESIGDYAFYGCDNLSTVIYTGTTNDKESMSISNTGNDALINAVWEYSGSGVPEEPDTPEDIVKGDTGECDWELDGTVLTISGNGAMGDYEISNLAPWGWNITQVIIEDGVTSIGNSAFEGCSSLESITIPDSVTSIGKYAFGMCKKLTSITIPVSVTTIEDYAFNSCTNLTTVNYGGSEADKESMSISDIGNEKFINATWVYNYEG